MYDVLGSPLVQGADEEPNELLYNRFYREPMLTIRKEQMDVFSAYMLSENVPKMVEDFEVIRRPHYLRMGAERSREFVHSAVTQGLVWGIRKFSDLWALIDLMLEFGPDFALPQSRPWVHKILNSESLSGTAKIKLVAADMYGHLE
jgi:hypothetical protein